jgi:uncharacterized protein YkwD
MRKPLVVVCAVAAGVLLAGGIAATTAGADETPDVPSIPGVAMPDLPDLPAGADLPGAPDQAGLQPPVAGRPGAGPDATTPDGQTPGVHDQGAQDQGVQDQDAQDQDHHHSAQDQAAVQAHDQVPQRPGGSDQSHATTTPHKPASPAAAAQRDVSPGEVSTSLNAPVQQQVLALVNDNRRRGGCASLSLDPRLITAAYGHAADMARRGYFAHESPNGEGAGERVQDTGYKWSRYGENIARGPDSAYEVVDGWMHSPEHRENIMDCKLREMGIGLAFDSDRTPYWVQDFATPQN